jgi:hypothetical protein
MIMVGSDFWWGLLGVLVLKIEPRALCMLGKGSDLDLGDFFEERNWQEKSNPVVGPRRQS